MKKSPKKSLNLELTAALRSYVDERTDGSGLYATPSEYIRDLIRQDMEDHAALLRVAHGLADLKKGRLSPKSILEIGEGK